MLITSIISNKVQLMHLNLETPKNTLILVKALNSTEVVILITNSSGKIYHQYPREVELCQLKDLIYIMHSLIHSYQLKLSSAISVLTQQLFKVLVGDG